MLTDAQAQRLFGFFDERYAGQEQLADGTLRFRSMNGLALDLPQLEDGFAQEGGYVWHLPKALQQVGPVSFERLTPGVRFLRIVEAQSRKLQRIRHFQGKTPLQDALEIARNEFLRTWCWTDLDPRGWHAGKASASRRVRLDMSSVEIPFERGVPRAESQIRALNHIAAQLLDRYVVTSTSTSEPAQVFDEFGPQDLFSYPVEMFVPFGGRHDHPKRHGKLVADIRNCEIPYRSDRPIVGVVGGEDLPGVNALVMLAQDPRGRNAEDMTMVREGFLPKLATMRIIRQRVYSPRWVAPLGAAFSWKERGPVAEDQQGRPVYPRLPYARRRTWRVVEHIVHEKSVTVILATRIEAQNGTKITSRHSSKGTIRRIPDAEMPVVDICGETRRVDVVLNPINLEKRGIYGMLLELLASRLAVEKAWHQFAGEAGNLEPELRTVHTSAEYPVQLALENVVDSLLGLPPLHEPTGGENVAELAFDNQPPVARLDVPINAEAGWLSEQLTALEIPEKLTCSLLPPGRKQGESLGTFVVGWLQLLLMPQHPEIQARWRNDRIVCPECQESLPHEQSVCPNCDVAGVKLTPESRIGAVPNRARYGVRVIFSYFGFLMGLHGLVHTVQEILGQRNPAARKHVQQMLEMLTGVPGTSAHG